MTHDLSASIYLLKVNTRNTRTRCEICTKLTIKIPERCQRRQYFTLCSTVSMVNFKHVIVGWARVNVEFLWGNGFFITSENTKNNQDEHCRTQLDVERLLTLA